MNKHTRDTPPNVIENTSSKYEISGKIIESIKGNPKNIANVKPMLIIVIESDFSVHSLKVNGNVDAAMQHTIPKPLRPKFKNVASITG